MKNRKAQRKMLRVPSNFGSDCLSKSVDLHFQSENFEYYWKDITKLGKDTKTMNFNALMNFSDYLTKKEFLGNKHDFSLAKYEFLLGNKHDCFLTKTRLIF